MIGSLNRRCLAPIAVSFLLFVCPLALATSIEPVTFQELVARAERIFVGEVTSVESFEVVDRAGRHVRTRVMFRADQALRGGGSVVLLEFTGGTVGDVTERVVGMPEFAVGERYVVFARNDPTSINPIVGFTQGLFHVSRDARDGTLRVLTQSRAPVASVAAIGRPTVRVSRDTTVPISLPAFLDDVRSEMAKSGGR